ncbi:ergothioneine biosynthesis protein EgtC [Streptomyces sodiiphilus]|uniref:Gamma-glutamyl-hercynylcysteine sulfoxide hydrolase n=1 Tax=Streptomyces sodiiphilus TaxID=226217 RepID=A0ABP5AHU4_9ACTN
MCRHLARLGPPVTLAELILDPPHSLYRQSWQPGHQRHGTVNADGFGIGWYPPDGEPPLRYRRSVPIWADSNLPDLARSLTGGAVLAAVRDATPGTSQDETACAPYRTGRWLFSHNGAVPDWRHLPDDLGALLPSAVLLGLEAHCDSAVLWALLHRRLADGEPPDEAVAATVLEIAAVRPTARLNLLLTDGLTIVASRWGDSLWYRSNGELSEVASEPADATPDWHEVPDRSLLLATRTAVRHTPLTPAERTLTA